MNVEASGHHGLQVQDAGSSLKQHVTVVMYVYVTVVISEVKLKAKS